LLAYVHVLRTKEAKKASLETEALTVGLGFRAGHYDVTEIFGDVRSADTSINKFHFLYGRNPIIAVQLSSLVKERVYCRYLQLRVKLSGDSVPM
jgi:hypothetical protein